MATLRRISSLDRASTHFSSMPTDANCSTSRLVRHSSLPNLVFGTGQRAEHLAWSTMPFMNSFATGPTSVKVSLDNIVDLSISDTPLARATAFCRSALANDRCSVVDMPDVVNSSASTTQENMDAQKSVVYADLRDSMWRFAAPERSALPVSHKVEEIYMGDSTLIDPHDMSKQLVRPMPCHTTNDDANGRPLSLKMLKRKGLRAKRAHRSGLSRAHGSANRPVELTQIDRNTRSGFYGDGGEMGAQLGVVGDSISNALSSLVYMTKMVHEYALQARAAMVGTHGCEAGCYTSNFIGRAYAEMLESFLWLFEHVFSFSPRLMLMIMIFLADFTLHSMSKHVPLPVVPSDGLQTAPLISPYEENILVTKESEIHENIISVQSSLKYRPIKGTCRSENGSVTCNDKEHHDAWQKGDRITGRSSKNCVGGVMDDTDNGSLSWGKLMKNGRSSDTTDRYSTIKQQNQHVEGVMRPAFGPFEREVDTLSSHTGAVVLNTDLKQMLVAPVQAPQLEPDGYPCYDRTNLNYEHEISKDPANSLLLSNYAQFLHVVRHDHGRAEELYRRALRAEGEAVDGNLMEKYASFMWVAKGDLAEAERAYKAAVAANPSNAFHAGCYAHFLWSSSTNDQAQD